MNVVLITGSEKRHAAYAEKVSEQLQLKGIVIEKKRVQIAESEMTPVVERHQEQRAESEDRYFGASDFDKIITDQIFVNTGEANSESTFEWVKSLNPDYILLYGSSIIKDPIMKFFEGKIINLHLGLSPYYKGAATLFWPVVYDELGALGTTFHIASAKVDAGPIIHQVRPELQESDNLYDIGNRAMLESFLQIGKVVSTFNSNPEKAIVQSKLESSKLFKKNDFNEENLIKAWRNIEENIVPEFLEKKNIIFAEFPIITCY